MKYMDGAGEKIPQRFIVEMALPEDLKQIGPLVRESWVKTMSEALGQSRERWEEAFDNYPVGKPVPDRQIFVAKDGKTLLGVCTVVRNANEAGENELLVLHVLPSKTGSGIGGVLWRTAEKVLDPTKNTYLWTTPGTEAVNTYKKWGFEPVEYTTQDFPTREPLSRPRVKMVKKAETIDS